jgi:hypothetical protein
MYPNRGQQHPTTRIVALGIGLAYFVWHKEWSSRLFSDWFMLRGLPPDEAYRRTFRFSASATLWGWGSVWVMLFGWFVVYVCGAGMLPSSVAASWLQLPSYEEYASGPAPYGAGLLHPIWWSLATAAGVFILWGYLLLGNKLWKAVSHDLIPPRDHWWQFHPRPKMVEETGLNVTPQDRARDVISTVLIKLVLYTPLVVTLLTVAARPIAIGVELHQTR